MQKTLSKVGYITKIALKAQSAQPQKNYKIHLSFYVTLNI